MVDPPTFQVPLTFAKGGCRVVEQGSDTDLRQCVEAALRTRRGSRVGLPTFGISDQSLTQGGADLRRLEAEVGEHEDRVEAVASREGPLRDIVDEVLVELGQGDEQ